MHLITGSPAVPLWDVAHTRAVEQALATRLPPHTLMERAGDAIARLARALTPHAQRIWVACGPGNNGGDGLMAAALMIPWVRAANVELIVSWMGNIETISSDARHALLMAQDAGISFSTEITGRFDLGIDAMLGIGGRTTQTKQTAGSSMQMQRWKELMHGCAQHVLNVDVPSGLDANTGWISPDWAKKTLTTTSTLTFLSVKPGLFTAHGKDEAGEVWFDDLGLSTHSELNCYQAAPRMWLGHPLFKRLSEQICTRSHQSHKGTFGDVWILGGQHPQNAAHGMVGAAILAGRAALHAGAGRVHVVTLGESTPLLDWLQPELMFRNAESIQDPEQVLPAGVWVCGCGGGSAIESYLSKLLQQASTLVLDADALNQVAKTVLFQEELKLRYEAGKNTILTPHPLEAARLLGCDTASVMRNRHEAASSIASRFNVICVLKGSGTIVATPNKVSYTNPTGSSRLATAGTGDVLAGWLGGHLARSGHDFLTDDHVFSCIYHHGLISDLWSNSNTLTAGAMVHSITI